MCSQKARVMLACQDAEIMNRCDSTVQLQPVSSHKNKPKHKPSTSTWAIFEGSTAHPNCLATPPMHLVVIASRRMSWCFLASPRASSQHCTFLLEVVAPPISRQLVTRTVTEEEDYKLINKEIMSCSEPKRSDCDVQQASGIFKPPQ